MARRYVDVTHAFTGLVPADRIERLRATLADERAAAQDSSLSSWDARVAEKNVESLEDALTRAEHNERLHAERITDLQIAEDAATAANRNEEQAAIEADVRRRYTLAVPKPVSDAEWEAVRESVLHRYRLSMMDRHDELVAETAARYRQML